MLIHLRNVILALWVLSLLGCCCDPKSQCGTGECPFDRCISSCPPPRDCGLTVRELARIEKTAGPFGTANLVIELQKKGVQVIEIGENVIILLPVDKFFEVNCATIRLDAYHALDYLICLLNHYGCMPLYISGHTDNITSRCFNLYLSDLRAQSIQAYLWVRGIHFRRMCANGCGDCKPIANQVTVPGHAANRRIEIRIRRTGCC